MLGLGHKAKILTIQLDDKGTQMLKQFNNYEYSLLVIVAWYCNDSDGLAFALPQFDSQPLAKFLHPAAQIGTCICTRRPAVARDGRPYCPIADDLCKSCVASFSNANQGWQVSAKGGLNRGLNLCGRNRFLPQYVNILKIPKFTTLNYRNAPNH